MRTNFAAHMYSAPFAKLARHPRMVDPVRQLFGEDVYMHQFKVNGKAIAAGETDGSVKTVFDGETGMLIPPRSPARPQRSPWATPMVTVRTTS